MASGAITIAETDMPKSILLIFCISWINSSSRVKMSWRVDEVKLSWLSLLIVSYSPSHTFLLYGYISFHFWMDIAIIVKVTWFVSNEGNGLAFRISQILRMDIEFIYVKVMFSMG